MKKFLFIILTALSVSSCNTDTRLVKKFIYRMNAGEVKSASKYIYPADQPSLYLFNEAIFAKSPNILFEITELRKGTANGHRCVVAKFEVLNMTEYFKNYMTREGFLHEGNMLADTFYIRKTDAGKSLSFNWVPIRGERLKLASISDPENVKRLNIRAGAGENFQVLAQIVAAGKIIIDDDQHSSHHEAWAKCYFMDAQNNIGEGYVSRSFLKAEYSPFFKLGFFGKFGVLISLIVLVIVAVPLLFVGAIVEAFDGAPVVGIVLIVGIILGALYSIYNLLENILFEMFLINLPG